MLAAASCSSSAAAPLSEKPYDVFISFRGEDTRRTFTSHLDAALRRNHIQVYKDDTSLEKGDEVWPALADAIQSSYLCIVVFSEDYASSTWCLRELTHILECKKSKEVIPVFYQIDPSQVRKQTESYEKAFQKHKENSKIDEETLHRWRVSLEKAGNLSGFYSESKDYRDDCQLIEDMVKKVLQKLEHIYSPIDREGLVGIDDDCAIISRMLREFQTIGLWGMGGIGKTTIARVLFNKHKTQYEGQCFLENIRESSGKQESRLSGLRKKLFCELLQEDNVDAESGLVRRRLRCKKVFVVLDDVDTPEQIKYLVGEINFGPDSKFVVTSRDRRVLRSGKVEKIHDLKVLNFRNSLELFSLNAFHRDHPQKGFKELSEWVVNYTKGLPLALKLIGSSLYSTCQEVWKSALEKLKKYPHEPIKNVLRWSYDGLDKTQKDIFLDIAFFFKGERKDDVENVLNACKFYATSGLQTLKDKALITISNGGKVEMHDLIQEMGWEIERENCEDPGKRRRLRDLEEICDVLRKKKGSDVIEGIILDVSQTKDDLHLSGNVFKKMTKLRILKFFFPNILYRNKNISKIYPSDDDSFSDSLRYFRWDAYPLKSLPQTLCLGMLVELHIQGSHVESLDVRAQDLANLKRINLTGCKWLREAPDFSFALNLESINLSYCKRLLGVPMTFCAEKLVHLDMCGSQIEKLWDGAQELVSLKEIKLVRCEKLTELPDFSKASKLGVVNLSYCKSLRCIHPSLLSLQSLYKLNLDWCINLRSLQSRIPPDNLVFLYLSYCLSLREFSLSSVNIQVLDLSETATEALPSSIGRCSNLKNLFLNNLRIKSLPNELSNLQSLVRLDISGCRELDTWNLHIIFDGLCSLHDLILDGTNVESLPDCIKHLSSLEYIGISNCKRLQSLPELPPSLKRLVANNCPSLETVTTPTTLNSCKTVLDKPFGMSFRNCMKLDERSLDAIATHAHNRIKLVAACQCDHCVGFCFPGNKVPWWFTNQIIRSSISTELPTRSDLLGFALCVVLSLEFSSYEEGKFSRSPSLEIECKCYLGGNEIVRRTYTMFCPRDKKRVSLLDHVILWYDETDSEAMMKAIRDSTAKQTSCNPKLSFQFSARVIYYEGNQVLDDAIKECGVWPIYASECDYPEEEMEVLVLGNKTKKCKDMDRTAKKLKPTFLATGMELEFEANTSEIGVGSCELKEFIFQPLPIDNGRQDLTEINFNCLLNRSSELDKTITEGRLLSIDASESHDSTNKMELDWELLELGLDHKSKRSKYDLEADEQQLPIYSTNFEQPVPRGSKELGLDHKSKRSKYDLEADQQHSTNSEQHVPWGSKELGLDHKSKRSKYDLEADEQHATNSEQHVPRGSKELGLDHKSKRSKYDLEADEQQLPLYSTNFEQPVPWGSKFKLEKKPQNYLFNKLDKKKENHRVLSVSVDVSESHDSINPMESYLELGLRSGHQSSRSVYDVKYVKQRLAEPSRSVYDVKTVKQRLAELERVLGLG